MALAPYVPAGVGIVRSGARAAKVAAEVASHADEVVDAGRVVAVVASHADEAAGALRAGKEVAQEVVEVAGRSSRPPIVIGENMERVRRYADWVGGETIDDWLAGRTWTQQLNDEFIDAVKREGREVIDIGPDFNRRLRYRLDPTDPLGRPPSPVYGGERRQLLGYEKYRRVYERFWKYGGGVPELDY